MGKLPKDLTSLHIKKAVDLIEKQTAEWIDLYFEQANIFSAIVGIVGVKALHAVSPYKKHKQGAAPIRPPPARPCARPSLRS